MAHSYPSSPLFGDQVSHHFHSLPVGACLVAGRLTLLNMKHTGRVPGCVPITLNALCSTHWRRGEVEYKSTKSVAVEVILMLSVHISNAYCSLPISSLHPRLLRLRRPSTLKCPESCSMVVHSYHPCLQFSDGPPWHQRVQWCHVQGVCVKG